MSNKTCLITGATSGIGRAAAIQLAAQGFDLILVGRNQVRGEAVSRQIQRRAPTVRVDFHRCDISSLEAVRTLAEKVSGAHPNIDVLMNNAGLRIDRYQESVDGIELTFATNHLGHFLLTQLLLQQLKQAESARVINVSSSAHLAALPFEEWIMRAKTYDRRQAYARSKLANILFTAELAVRLQSFGITVNSVHPGIVLTRYVSNNGLVHWLKHLAGCIRQGGLISSRQGADTLVYLAVSPCVADTTGKYFYLRQPVETSPLSQDPAVARKLWQDSVRLCELSQDEMP